jgi:hypothetical protein
MSSTTSASNPAKRDTMYRREVAQRAALYYRLGHTAADAKARLCAYAAWDFEATAGGRPKVLTDEAIAEIVEKTYARRPASSYSV